MPSGHTGVYLRKDGGKHVYKRKGGKVVSSQLPIRELYGPSVGGMYGNDRVQAAMQRAIAGSKWSSPQTTRTCSSSSTRW